MLTGMDAQVSYEFHRKRQEHPEMFKNQLVNQVEECIIYLKENGSNKFVMKIKCANPNL